MELDPGTVQLIGYVAATLTTGSFIPQALMTLRTRDVSGISAAMYSAFVAGVALWLVYGLLLGDWPLIAANATALVLAGTILTIKLREQARGSSDRLPPPQTGRAGAERPQNEKRTPAE